jgi:hypothetical protein
MAKMTAIEMRYRQAPAVHSRTVGNELFLVHPNTGAIHTLDALGAAVWRLLGEPKSAKEIRRLLAAAFPKVAATRIAADVSRLLLDLYEGELIQARRTVSARSASRKKSSRGKG